MSFRTPFFLPALFGGLTWRMPTSEKEIFLTFDDGPVPDPTEYVLTELEKAQARATFFCIGDNVRKYPEIFQKVLAGGHTIGNHTYNHWKGWNHSTSDYIQNIQKCDEQFRLHQVNGCQLFRPPYGRITFNQIRAVKDKYQVIMWDVLTRDYAASLSPEHCLKGSLAATRPGSIVVFHDSLKAKKNLIFVLPRFLQHFTERGYRFSAL